MDQQVIYNDFSHINEQLPKRAKGFALVTYAIALEGWRRGLELKFYTGFVKNQTRIYYKLKSDEHDYNFKVSFGGNMDKQARKIVDDKEKTKKHLLKNNVPVPQGKAISIEDGFDNIIAYIDSIGYPVVVKPISSRLGKGVHTNLLSKKEVEAALDDIKKLGYTEIMVEQFINGEDTRVFVIDGKVEGAYKRRPANVIGDGEKTIEQLITVKNKIRQTNPHAKKNKLEINNEMVNYLKESGFDLNSVPKKGQMVYLTDSTLHIDGCEVVDITDEISPQVEEVAINAVKAIPNLGLSGLDVMIDNKRNQGFVLELNASPNIAGHIFPMEGKSKDIPKAFIDYFFPETKEVERQKFDDFTFDFDNITRMLRSGAVTEVTVPKLPEGPLNARNIRISGEVSKLVSWIRRKAVGLKLGGEITEEDKNLLDIKVAGASEAVEKFVEEVKGRQNRKIQVEVSDDGQWNGLYQYYFKSLVDFDIKR